MRLSSFSEMFIAATRAAALAEGEAVLSHIVLFFKGPLAQSGPIAA